ncbi:MAG: peptidylprolyl isomerase [Clostridia bacterium]|nr:peptidylprolyl isomerase [Clostridia bacterium]
MKSSEVLAVVGNREITRGDVESLLQSLNPQTARQFQSEAGMKNLVKELVNQELFYLDAVDKGLDQEEDFQAEIERMKAGILKQYAIGKLMKNIAVSENDIAEYYEAYKSDFITAPSVKASHILVDTLEQAEDISSKISGGLTFEEAAKEFSKCPSNARGGDLGYFTSGQMVPEFEQAAFETEKGQMSAPVKTQFGYHLIKVYDKKDTSSKSIDEVRGQITEQLVAQKQQQVYQSKVDELKGNYAIQLNV